MSTGDRLVNLSGLKIAYDAAYATGAAPRLVVPDRWDAVVGDELQLFYRGIVEAPDPYGYDIEFVCDIGKNTGRYYTVTPTAAQAGDHAVTIRARDHRGVILAEAASVLTVHAAPAAPAAPLNILCVGDSLTNDGEWVNECARRLIGTGGTPEGRGLANIAFIGSRSNPDPEQVAAAYEGYGGWTWATYLREPSATTLDMWVTCPGHDKTAEDQHSLWKDGNDAVWQMETIEEGRIKFTRYEGQTSAMPTGSGTLTHAGHAAHPAAIAYTDTYTGSGNPFWSATKGDVDFQAYCTRNGFSGIGLVVTLLTWNTLSPWITDPTTGAVNTHATNARAFLRKLHTDYPDAKVLIMGLQCPSVNGGTGASYGAMGYYANWYGIFRTAMTLNLAYKAIAEETEFSGWVTFVHMGSQFDSENNMKQKSTPVNTRSSATETVGTNGVHPAAAGYMQIADAAYRAIVGAM